MIRADLTEARGLIEFIDASPSPFHACAETARLLEAVGFQRLDERAAWPGAPGRYYVLRAGSIAAWIVRDGQAEQAGFRVIGAHTDSPNLRVKPRPNSGRAGYRQLGVEIYGGVLLNSWLDRDLGLSGRVVVSSEQGPQTRLLRIQRPILRLPQLAIHLDREVNSKGLVLDKQQHMSPIWSLGAAEENGFQDFLASELGVDPDCVLAWDIMCHDLTPSTVLGRDEDFVSAPRLDNLCSCYCALRALLENGESSVSKDLIPIICLFDHEEVGSTSARGAAGPLLGDLLERIVLGAGGNRDSYHRAIASSICCSADMAHATHPNYTNRHEPGHFLEMNAGPVIKINANLRYASDAEGEAIFQTCCSDADVPYQKWVNRTNLACGSTIGPITAARLGMRTVDVGNPQLAMHSAREICGALDPAYMVRAMTVFMDCRA